MGVPRSATELPSWAHGDDLASSLLDLRRQCTTRDESSHCAGVRLVGQRRSSTCEGQVRVRERERERGTGRSLAQQEAASTTWLRSTRRHRREAWRSLALLYGVGSDTVPLRLLGLVPTQLADADGRVDSTRLMVVSLASTSSDDTAFISSPRLPYTPLWTLILSVSTQHDADATSCASLRCRGVGTGATLLLHARRLLFVTVTVAEFRVRRCWRRVHREVMRLEVRGRWMAACRCTVQLSPLSAWAFVCPSVVDASPCWSAVVSRRLEVSERGCDCG